VGASQAASAVDPDPRAEEFCDTPGGGRYPGGASETLRQVSRATEGQPLGAGQAPSGSQEGRLIRPLAQIHWSSRRATVLCCTSSVKRQAEGKFSEVRIHDSAYPQLPVTLDLRQVTSIPSDRPQHLALQN